MKQCRIMITKKCNLKCSYCLMKNKEIMKTIKPETIDNILKNEYSAYLITGGEPIYNDKTFKLMIDVIVQITAKENKPLYLYTNGLNITLSNILVLSDIYTSINIGLHGPEIDYDKLLAIKKFVPIRLHRQDILMDKRLKLFCEIEKIPLKIWVKDKCDTVAEDRFILKCQ